MFCLISLAFADEIGAEEDDRRNKDNHRAGRRRVEIGEEQADDTREQPEQQGIAVIPAHIARDIARRRGGENEHRVDEQQSTMRIDSITVTAVTTTNRLSYSRTGTPLLRARAGEIATAWKPLKQRNHTTTIATKAPPSIHKSVAVTLRMSPIKIVWYLAKLPRESSTRPSATPQEENTPIIVSVEAA